MSNSHLYYPTNLPRGNGERTLDEMAVGWLVGRTAGWRTDGQSKVIGVIMMYDSIPAFLPRTGTRGRGLLRYLDRVKYRLPRHAVQQASQGPSVTIEVMCKIL